MLGAHNLRDEHARLALGHRVAHTAWADKAAQERQLLVGCGPSRVTRGVVEKSPIPLIVVAVMVVVSGSGCKWRWL
jgi:hypothetical protein